MTAKETRSRSLSETRGAVPPVKLAHVVRRTSRLDEMVAWYQEVLGAETVHADEMLAFLTYDDEHHRIAIVGLPGLDEQSDQAVGTDHIAFTYAGIGDLLYTYKRLKGRGIEPYWCLNHGPTTSMYFKDPDGSRVELQVDNFETLRECNEWMTSGVFAANPIGVIFDPDELLARYEAGEPLEDLLRQSPLPEGATPFDMLRM
ncbi:MAG: VOC family protein [Proteobacteria bacterium]|nr:VOC family protein [Pseudomonadota bacterium]